MIDVYTYFYTISTNAKDKMEEYLLNFNEIAEFDKAFDFLPDISPKNSVVKKILELA